MAKTKDKNLEQFMDRVPPCLIRIMAIECGKGRRPRLKTIDEIVQASKLSRRMVQRLASRKTWKDVKIGVASAFISGCGVDILHRAGIYQFLRQYADHDFPHLDEAQRTRFLKLMGL